MTDYQKSLMAQVAPQSLEPIGPQKGMNAPREDGRIADAIDRLADNIGSEGEGAGVDLSLDRIARAITDMDASRGHDAAGGTVGCLTEAAMGMTAALVQIAQAIERLADAVVEHGQSQ